MVLREDLVQPPGAPLLRDSSAVRVSDLSTSMNVAMAGVPWDWSISGRPGPRFAPQEIRRFMLSLYPHAPGAGDVGERPYDVGDLKVAPGDYGKTSRRLRSLSRALYGSFSAVLWLGGDHSITEHIVEGLVEARGRVVVLVLDAHYDMRSVEEGLSSGTWLWSLKEKLGDKVEAVVAGVEDYLNPGYLAERARKASVRVIPASTLRSHGPAPVLEALEETPGLLYVSVDMDHLSQAYAPGVNSPNPLGLDPWTTISLLDALRETGRCPVGSDIVEYAPTLDPLGSTGRLAGFIAVRLASWMVQCNAKG